MPANPRKNFSEAENADLVTQVQRICPLCSKSLYRSKNNRTYKNYEIAHIYPLNATPVEEMILQNEEKLSLELNHDDNLIPLCIACHDELDNPRTVEEYRQLCGIKKELIERSKQQLLWQSHTIEAEVRQILEALYSQSPEDLEVPIEYNPKAIEEKFDSSLTMPTKIKIKYYVASYYPWIRNQLNFLDKSYPETSQIISSQIKAFHLQQRKIGSDQQAAFEGVVGWIHARAKPKTREGAEILAAFFIQNCEIFS